MVKVNPLIESLNAGEFGPDMENRVEFNKYRVGGSRVENLMVLAQGGITRRPGTEYIGPIKDEAVRGRLKPFVFAVGQAFALEMADFAFRFYTERIQISVGATSTAIVNGTFATDINNWTDQSGAGGTISWNSQSQWMDLNSSTASGIARAEQQITVAPGDINTELVLAVTVYGLPGDKVRCLVGTTSGAGDVFDRELLAGGHLVSFTPPQASIFLTFENEATPAAGTITVGIDDIRILNNEPIEVASPWAISEVYDVFSVQSADILYLFSNLAPYKLERRGVTNWSLVAVDWEDGPYLAENTTPTTMTIASNVLGTVTTATASAVENINDGQGFQSTDIGRLLRYKSGTNPDWGYGQIRAVNSPTEVDILIKRVSAAGTANTAWRLGAWSNTTGYPRAQPTFWEQRMVTANTREQPQTFWTTQTADIENMRPDSFNNNLIETQDDDGIVYTIAGDQVDEIKWFAVSRQLAVGTIGGEWTVTSDGPVLTPSDVEAQAQTSHKSAPVAPVRVGNLIVFLQLGRRKLREFGFVFEVDSFRAPDLTILASHVSFSGIVEMTYQEEPYTSIYTVRADGQLATLNFRREEDIFGWGRHVLGGNLNGGHAEVESAISIPGDAAVNTEEIDEVWCIVKRTINGQTRRYIEAFTVPFLQRAPNPNEYDTKAEFQADLLEAQKDAWYVDAGLKGVFDPPVTTVSGLDHLEGESLAVLADGAVLSDLVVCENGCIELPTPASTVIAGLPYRHTYKSLKLAAGGQSGSAVGKTKGVHAVTFVLLHSQNVAQGPDLDSQVLVPIRTVEDPMDTAVPLFTGETRIEFSGDFVKDPRIFITGDKPLPFTLLGMAPEMYTEDAL